MNLTTYQHVQLYYILYELDEKRVYGFDFELSVENAMLVAKANDADWFAIKTELENISWGLHLTYNFWSQVIRLKDVAMKTMYKTIRDRLGY